MIYIKDHLDVKQVALALSCRINASIDKTSKAFERFFWEDERSQYWFYNEEECQTVIEEMIQEFLEDVLKKGQETLAGKVARETGLELIDEASFIRSCNWMEVV